MKGLTPKQHRFVEEYLVDLNATQAAIRAGYSKKTAEWIGPQLLGKTHVAAEIQKRMQDRQARTEITQDKVLERWWQLANANPNELVEYRRFACRHCHGNGHAFQWRDQAEWIEECRKAEREDSPQPDDAGGYGYSANLLPVPDCPQCDGLGEQTMVVKDTRKLSPAALALYAGVKTSKDGIEVKMHDQMAALTNVARHLGMFNDKLDLTVNTPLADRLARARERNNGEG